MTAILEAPPRPEGVDERLYEIVGGEVKEKTVGTRQNLIAFRIGRLVVQADPDEKHGQAVIENLFILDDAADLQRRPDFAFVSRQRWSTLPPDTNAWNVMPDWMVEIISPSNSADEVIDKVDEYFRAGTRLVWVIYPHSQRVYVYTSPTNVTICEAADELTAAPVLPALRFRATALFEGIAVSAATRA
jgi:Uma2 family endonuclease